MHVVSFAITLAQSSWKSIRSSESKKSESCQCMIHRGEKLLIHLGDERIGEVPRCVPLLLFPLKGMVTPHSSRGNTPFSCWPLRTRLRIGTTLEFVNGPYEVHQFRMVERHYFRWLVWGWFLASRFLVLNQVWKNLPGLGKFRGKSHGNFHQIPCFQTKPVYHCTFQGWTNSI